MFGGRGQSEIPLPVAESFSSWSSSVAVAVQSCAIRFPIQLQGHGASGVRSLMQKTSFTSWVWARDGLHLASPIIPTSTRTSALAPFQSLPCTLRQVRFPCPHETPSTCKSFPLPAVRNCCILCATLARQAEEFPFTWVQGFKRALSF